MEDPLSPIYDLMHRAFGDEKHDRSAHSTLDILWVLYNHILRHDPHNPHWEERDRFLLSKGHGPLALYAILVTQGYFPAEMLDRIEQEQGILGDHPDRLLVPGIEISTGSLGHGLPIALGVAQGLLAKGGTQHVYVLVGDGECNEGSIWEAIMLAPQLHLSNLTCIVVNNHSSFIHLGDIAGKFATFGWAASNVDGHDHVALTQALSQRNTTSPLAVIATIQ